MPMMNIRRCERVNCGKDIEYFTCGLFPDLECVLKDMKGGIDKKNMKSDLCGTEGRLLTIGWSAFVSSLISG